MLKKKKNVTKQADDNVEVSKRADGETKTLKKGSHVDHSEKHLNSNTVGMSIGTTVNMENYESLRVDVWATIDLEDKSIDEGYEELFGILDNKLKKTVQYYTDDSE